MRIIDMVNANFPDASKLAERNTQDNVAFKMLLNEAERRSPIEPENRNRDDNRGKNQTNEARREEQPYRRREKIQQRETEDVTGTAGTAAVYEQVTPEENTAVETVINETEAIEKIAEILQVPVEVVIEIMQQLEITAQDLLDPQAVAKILQIVLDVENPVELLTNPEFPEFYKAINEALTEMQAEVKPTLTPQNTNATVKENNETVATVTDELETNLEELEAKIEDGKLVITKPNETENTRTQSTSQPTTQAATVETPQVSETEDEIKDVIPLIKDEPVMNEPQAVAPSINVESTVTNTEQTVRQTAQQQPVNAANIIEQIMNQVQVSNSGGQFTEIKITLRPESLGDIVLRVLTQNGIVMAQFEAENQRVKETLEASFNQLRDALTEQGIKFSELSVSVRQDEKERMNQFEKARQNSQHRAESVEDVSEEISYHNGVIDLTA